MDEMNRIAQDGFPHKHFANVAFVAGLLEDLAQVVLQIAFMIVIESNDGWAITGAMASLTLSVADFYDQSYVSFVHRTYCTMRSSSHATILFEIKVMHRIFS